MNSANGFGMFIWIISDLVLDTALKNNSGEENGDSRIINFTGSGLPKKMGLNSTSLELSKSSVYFSIPPAILLAGGYLPMKQTRIRILFGVELF